MADVFTVVNTNMELELDKRQLEIHIKIQKRNGRKCWTIVEGLDKLELPSNLKTMDDFLDAITRKFKKSFNCGATVKKPENAVHLNGDHRDVIKKFLIETKLVNEDQIKLHGF